MNIGKIVIATENKDKLAEIQRYLSKLGLEFETLDQCAERLGKQIPQIIEDGKTLEENALIKAKTVSDYFGVVALGDDTGLKVKQLKGRPGVYTGRYHEFDLEEFKKYYPDGADKYAKNRIKLLKELEGIPYENREATFETVVAIVFPKSFDQVPIIAKGKCHGYILEEPRGENSWGFNPLFYYPPYDKTFAQMNTDEKNEISHRGSSLRDLHIKLRNLLEIDKHDGRLCPI